MNEAFDLPVTYKGKELLFPARLLQLGYNHQFLITVDGIEVIFEPDEERSYRAIIHTEEAEKSKADIELLQTIAETIEELLK